MHRSQPSSIAAALAVALALSVVACTGAPPAPTASPTSAAATSAPTTAPPTAAPPTAAPPTAAPPTGAPTSSATLEPPPATPTALLTPDASATIRDLASVSGALAAGTYRLNLDPSGPAELPPILITLPEGWSKFADWALFARQDAEGGTDDNIAVMFWDVAHVYGHPCDSRGTLLDPGPTVDDLAAALVDIPLRNATEPIDVTVDGYAGKYLEWSVPGEAVFAECDTNNYVSWTAKGWASERYHQGPGQVDRLWILDVDGVRLVIDAFYMPWTTSADREELEDVVESIRFER